MKNRLASFGLVSFGMGLAMVVAAPAVGRAIPTSRSGPADVVREGSGERRTKLDAMELKSFPTEAWGQLSDWTGGRAISSADTSGQVVLICTCSDWYPPAQRAWAMAQRLAADHAKDGLVVVGAYHHEGWAEAKKPEASKGADGPKLFVGHDAKGEFRKAILSDQDPDFYVIDRAGQLRFADITTESVAEAVNQCLAEKIDDAANLNTRLADDRARADAEARRTAAIRDQIDLKTLPEVPFVEPGAEAYEKIKNWPKKEKKDNSSRDEDKVLTLTLPPPGSYYKKDPVFKGRAVVVYVWSPDFRPSYDKIMPMMDQLQRQRGRDLCVIGAMARIEDRNGRDKPVDTTDPQTLIKKFVDEPGLQTPQTIYVDGMIGEVENRSSSEVWVPYVVVASSNGVVRWAGSPNHPSFAAAVEQVLTVDPGVKARREAEDAFIKKQQKK